MLLVEVPGPTEDTETTPVDQLPAIDLIKNGMFNDENMDGFAQVGETISYTFEATNIGNVTLSNIIIIDPIIGSIDCGGIVVLMPGESNVCTGRFTLTQIDIDAGERFNIATVFGDGPNNQVVSDDDSHTEILVQEPIIGLSKNLIEVINNQDGTYDVSYLLVVENLGNVTLSNLIVTDDILLQFAGMNPTGIFGFKWQFSS